MNNNRFIIATAALCLAALSHSAFAAKGFKYSYVDAGYRYIDTDSSKSDGFNVSLSFGATDYVHVVAEYSFLLPHDIDGVFSPDLELNEFVFGMGGHYPVTPKFDLGGEVVYINQELTGDQRNAGATMKTRVNESDDGYKVTLFGRIQAMKKFEIAPHVSYRDVGEEDATGYGVDFIYRFYKKFSFKLGGTYFDEDDDDRVDVFAGFRLNL